MEPRVRSWRLPRSAVVALTGPSAGFSYAEAVRSIKSKINLQELDIENSKAVKYGTLRSLLVDLKAKKRRKLWRLKSRR